MKEIERNTNMDTEATATGECSVHEWVVFSTSLREGWLMLQCIRCGSRAAVDDPSAEEWQAAFHAPRTPYRWHEEDRLTIREHGPFCVVPRQPGEPCECIKQGYVAALGKYERVPGGIMVPDCTLTLAERADLSALADVAVKGGLCGRLLIHFLQGIQEHTGFEPSGAARRIAQAISEWDRKTLHMSPGLVARVLREWANYQEVQ